MAGSNGDKHKRGRPPASERLQVPGERPAIRIIDPWVAAGLPRPDDAPPVTLIRGDGFRPVAAVDLGDLISFITIQVHGLSVAIDEIVNLTPGLAAKLNRRLEELVKLKDVAAEVAETQEQGEGTGDGTGTPD